MRKSVWIMLVVSAVVAAAALVALRPADDLARDFRLDSLSHGRFYLHDQRGKCVVLVFWSVACRPCKAELAFLGEMQRELADERFVIAALCTDAETPDQARRAIEPLAIDYPVLLDAGGAVAAAWDAQTVPTTVIIAPDGAEAWRRTGYDASDGRAIRAHVQRLLSGAGGGR